VPDSQENDWQRLGFISDVELVESQESWDRAASAFESVLEEQRRLTEIVAEADMSARAFNILMEGEGMIDMRRTDYPDRDGYGTLWYDPSGFHTDIPGACFICEKPTGRMDIDLNTYFCNRAECNNTFREQMDNE
jgi:hypothetical protein